MLDFKFLDISKVGNGYPGTLGVIAEDEKLAFGPASCKGYIADVFGRAHGPAMQQTINSAFKGDLPKGALVLAFWSSKDTRDSNAEKFCAIINELEELMDVNGRTEVICPDIPEELKDKKTGAPFIAIAPKWWEKWPVMVSFYCLMMRLSPFMVHGESFKEFRSRTLKRRGADTNIGYFCTISDNGNLDMILTRSANFFKRKGYSDWLLHRHDRGIVDYEDTMDKELPITKSAICKYRKLDLKDNNEEED